MPSIIEAWLRASEKMTQPGIVGAERRQGRLVGDVAGGEQQRRLLAVEVGKLALEQDMVVVGAGDVARAAGAGAAFVQRLVHGRDHLGMLAHAEIVVRAPDGDFARLLARIAQCPRKTAGAPLKIGENTVASFLVQAFQLFREERLEIHRYMLPGGSSLGTGLSGAYRALARLFQPAVRPGVEMPQTEWSRRSFPR